MSKLVVLFKDAKFKDVRSYINSGNIVFEAGTNNPANVGAKLEFAIEKEFGFKVDIIIRTASQWKIFSAGSPFPRAETLRPNMLHLGLSKVPLKNNLTSCLIEKAQSGEKIKVLGDAIWVDFAKSVGKSKLTPIVFEKAVGAAVTLRNWNTVQKLWEMLNE